VHSNLFDYLHHYMQPFDTLVSNEMTQRSTSAAIDGANGQGVVNDLANDGKGKQGGVLPLANPPPAAAAADPPHLWCIML
jgi:hypothetical protein